MFARGIRSARACTRVAACVEQSHCLRQLPRQRFPPPLARRVQQRQVSTYKVVRERLKILYRGNPVTLPLALVSLAVSLGFVGYVTYGYFFYIKPIDHNYPETVAAKLKRAIYYTSLEPDLQKALKFYQQALVAANEAQMNPFSDEVIGIKLRIAHVLEENKQIPAAIKVQEALRADIRRWLEMAGERQEVKVHRTRLLRKSVQLSVKLGQLYSSAGIDDLEEAEKHLTEGVETALAETQRRERERTSDEAEGSWLSNEEMGGALEELAHHFDKRAQYSLSAPLFLRALTLDPPPCHAAMLMNSLAVSLAQTAPESSSNKGSGGGSGGGSLPPSSRAALLSNATAWAEKALVVAQATDGEKRTAECDECAALATANLGEFAEMDGLFDKARQQYERAIKVARDVKYPVAQRLAEEGLGRVQKRMGGKEG